MNKKFGLWSLKGSEKYETKISTSILYFVLCVYIEVCIYTNTHIYVQYLFIHNLQSVSPSQKKTAAFAFSSLRIDQPHACIRTTSNVYIWPLWQHIYAIGCANAPLYTHTNATTSAHITPHRLMRSCERILMLLLHVLLHFNFSSNKLLESKKFFWLHKATVSFICSVWKSIYCFCVRIWIIL